MPLLDDKQKADLLRHFKGLTGEVTVMLFARPADCDFCKVTTDLLNEVTGLSPKLQLQVLDVENDQAEAERCGVDKTPAVIVKGAGSEDCRIRFFGAPAGYEFTTLVEDLLMVSTGKHGLSAEVLAELGKVDQPVRVQVMTLPTCPYCPSMVRTAHRFALANKNITADMVEVSEFPALVKFYEVQGVPHTMIGETYGVVGVYKELDFIQEILRGIGKLPIELNEHVQVHEVTGIDSGPNIHEPHPHVHGRGVPPGSPAPQTGPKGKPRARKVSATAKPAQNPAPKTAAKKAGRKGVKK